MPTVYEQINTDVRAFFAAGHKSGNKSYSLEAALKADNTLETLMKVEVRNAAYKKSQKGRVKWWVLDIPRMDKVKMLLNMPPTERSGNCSEMAELAGYYAITKYNIAPGQVFIGYITAPGDHCFCLIGRHFAGLRFGSHRWQEDDYDTVTEFVDGIPASRGMIVDPWLNTVCKGSDYLLLAGAKLEKWSGDGKRVFWKSPTQTNMGWHNPSGEYKTQFAQAPVSLEPF